MADIDEIRYSRFRALLAELDATRAELTAATERIGKLEEALKFYADESNYDWDLNKYDRPSTRVGDDNGERAQAVLAAPADAGVKEK